VRIIILSTPFLVTAPLRAQTRPVPVLDAAATARAGRPLPGPVYETPAFSRAVARGTRTRTGRPGPRYWVQHARYRIDARLDPAADRLVGRERVVYLNHAPDTLDLVAVYLRQNAFAAGSPRLTAAPVTGGVTLARVAVGGRAIEAVPDARRAARNARAQRDERTGRGGRRAGTARAARMARAAGAPPAGGYTVRGTVMWIALPAPLLPGDSLTLDFAWSFTPPPPPSDGREGHEGHVYFLGYWYPQMAVYDDVDGWVTDPYLMQGEFYMDPADYDVRITAPPHWLVGATGTLQNPAEVLSPTVRERLARARRTGEVVHVVTPGERGSGRPFASGAGGRVWHFSARGVRDFAWGTSDRYVWDATRAVLGKGADADTVMIHSFYRLHAPAAAWAVGGARYTRDAVERHSAYLWRYPYPRMTSMEGVISGGGMEYPMVTLMQPWADTLSLAGDLMHETGHMWFPMQVGSDEKRFPWMDEGLTQFDVAQGMRVLYGEPRAGGRPNDSEPGQRRLYLARARAGLEHRLMQHGDRYPRSLYFIMQYDKTAQVLAALRAVLGPETFLEAYREYGHRWLNRHPQPFDFFNTFADVAGRDLSWFWSTWFYHGWSLDQAVAGAQTEGDSTTITIEDRGLAPMPVALAVTRGDGTTERIDVPVDVWLHGARRYRLRVASRPAVVRVEIDPDGAFPDVDRSNQIWRAGAGTGGGHR